MSLRSILLVNDYASLCKLQDRGCHKSILARKYLNYKISKTLKKRSESDSSFLYLLFGFLLIK
jgi:hypothetical protein